MQSPDRYRVGYGVSYDVLTLSLLLCAYGRIIAQCNHYDKSQDDQKALSVAYFFWITMISKLDVTK